MVVAPPPPPIYSLTHVIHRIAFFSPPKRMTLTWTVDVEVCVCSCILVLVRVCVCTWKYFPLHWSDVSFTISLVFMTYLCVSVSSRSTCVCVCGHV